MSESGSMRSHPLALKIVSALDSFATEQFRPDLFQQMRATSTDDIKSNSGDEEVNSASSSDSEDESGPIRPPDMIRFGQRSLFAQDPTPMSDNLVDVFTPDVATENTNFTRELAEAIFASLPQALPDMS